MIKQMGIIPEPGMVLLCDFVGYSRPEIDKNRQVIVVSPKVHNNWGTCLVVPISKSEPRPELPIHVKFDAGAYGFLYADKPCWAKANLLSHVRHERLDRVINNGVRDTPKLTPDDYARVIKALGGAFRAQI